MPPRRKERPRRSTSRKPVTRKKPAGRKPPAPRSKTGPRLPPRNHPARPTPSPSFPPPQRGPTSAEGILVVFPQDARDPSLDEFIAVMANHGHPVTELAVPDLDPFATRQAIRKHPEVVAGHIGGIVLSGRGIRPFTFEPRADSGPLPDFSDLPFGSDFDGFDAPARTVLSAAEIARQLEENPVPYGQPQWVSRVFTFNPGFLENLRTTQPPQVNNMLIVNADPNSHEPQIQERWRQRYGLLTSGQNARFAFRGPDFADEELLDYLETSLTNTTFVSLTDHGTSTNLEHLPGMRNGAPRLPALPDVVELAACATGRWVDDDALPMIKGLAETSLERGALAVIAPQCLLAWNFVKGSVGRPAHYHPQRDQTDQEVHNVAPWLDVWPLQGSLGKAQQFAVAETLGFLRESAYRDKGYLVHHVLCGHSLFGDGTVEFRSG